MTCRQSLSDVTDSESVARARDEVLARFPDLDVVVTMAGILLPEDLRDPAHIPPAVATAPEAKEVNPAVLDLDDYLDEVSALLASDPTPDEIRVQAVQMHRGAERDGTYDVLVAKRSQALAMLPSRQSQAV